MKIFWVVKARKLLLMLLACFAAAVLIYSWQFAAGAFLPWGKKEVLFMGHVLDPKSPRLEEEVARLTQNLCQQPVDAQYDPVNKSIIPDLNGFEIDVAKTAEVIRSARRGAYITPVWRETRAEKTLEQSKELPVYQGNPAKSQVALVFNVSWGNEYLEEILRILSEERVTASFFLVGRWAAENGELAKEIHDLGHDLGNHGYSDAHLQELDPEEIREEIDKTNKVVHELTGVELRWFSPPYGEKAEKIFTAAAQQGMHTILWSLDTVDWTLPGEEAIVNRIVPNLHNGAIILMHPTAQTPGALRTILAALRERGLQPVSVTELLNPSYWPQKYSNLWLGN